MDMQGFTGDSVVKNPSTVWKTQVNPWVGKVPLEKEMATHSNILA